MGWPDLTHVYELRPLESPSPPFDTLLVAFLRTSLVTIGCDWPAKCEARAPQFDIAQEQISWGLFLIESSE